MEHGDADNQNLVENHEAKSNEGGSTGSPRTEMVIVPLIVNAIMIIVVINENIIIIIYYYYYYYNHLPFLGILL